MAPPVPAAVISQVDQGMAESARHLNVLLAAYRRNITGPDDLQALASIALALEFDLPMEDIIGIVLAAVRKITRMEDQP